MKTVSNPKTAFLPDHLLHQVGNDQEMQSAIVAAFVDSFPGLLEKIKDCLITRDRENMKQYLHQIKSSLSLFGGDDPYQEAHSLEKSLDSLSDQAILRSLAGIIDFSQQLLQEVLNFHHLHKRTS